jgi:hypothetical protein
MLRGGVVKVLRVEGNTIHSEWLKVPTANNAHSFFHIGEKGHDDFKFFESMEELPRELEDYYCPTDRRGGQVYSYTLEEGMYCPKGGD